MQGLKREAARVCVLCPDGGGGGSGGAGLLGFRAVRCGAGAERFNERAAGPPRSQACPAACVGCNWVEAGSVLGVLGDCELTLRQS